METRKTYALELPQFEAPADDFSNIARSCFAGADKVAVRLCSLYRIVKRSVAESVPESASVHTRNAAFKAVSALEQYCSAPMLKVEHSVSDRFLIGFSESSLNTFIGAEIAMESRFGK